jgi:hypothetical protein
MRSRGADFKPIQAEFRLTAKDAVRLHKKTGGHGRLLALLLLHPNEVAPAGGLIDELWGEKLSERRLGVTESRVSPLYTKAFLRLKAHLSGAAREPAET